MCYKKILRIGNLGYFEMEIKAIHCKYCSSNNVVKYGTYNDTQYFLCKDCKRKFSVHDTLPRMKTPVDQIASAIGMYYDGLSQNKVRYQLKHVYDLDISDYAVYDWIQRFTKDAIEITDSYKPNTGYVWLCDETVIPISGKKWWLTDCIDVKTRFLLSSRLSKYRRVEDIQETLKEAYNRSGIVPKVIMTDHLHAYVHAIPMTFGNKTKHLQVKKFTAKPNNNIIERMQGTIKHRIKTMRGLKSPETARLLLNGFLINYNYFRPHETLSTAKPTTPAQKAGINLPYDSWGSLIRHSQEAKTRIFTKPVIPELKPIPLTKTQKQRQSVRLSQRKMLDDIRKRRQKSRLISRSSQNKPSHGIIRMAR